MPEKMAGTRVYKDRAFKINNTKSGFNLDYQKRNYFPSHIFEKKIKR